MRASKTSVILAEKRDSRRHSTTSLAKMSWWSTVTRFIILRSGEGFTFLVTAQTFLIKNNNNKMKLFKEPASKLSIWGSREKSRESSTRKQTRVRGAPFARAFSRGSLRLPYVKSLLASYFLVCPFSEKRKLQVKSRPQSRPRPRI